MNYDTLVSQEALAPLSGLQRLSVLHLYSVPGPQCHLRTWLLALPRLTHLSVHGEGVQRQGTHTPPRREGSMHACTHT